MYVIFSDMNKQIFIFETLLYGLKGRDELC